MYIHVYLMFDGQCEAAFRFYEKLLGGEIDTMMTHKDSPMADEVGPEWANQILHTSMKVGDTLLLGSDCPPGYFEKPQGFGVSLTIEDLAEAERVFNGLCEGGQVKMPFEKTFWAERFGMVTDRFGTPWMISGGHM